MALEHAGQGRGGWGPLCPGRRRFLHIAVLRSGGRAKRAGVRLICGGEGAGAFDVTIEEGTATGSATLEDGDMERTHPLEVISGDPSSGAFEVRVGDFRGDATISDGSLEIELQPADGSGAVAQGTGVRTEEGGDFFCGTFSGSDHGRWNLVITAEGKHSGSFWGSLATGTVTGRRNGSVVVGLGVFRHLDDDADLPRRLRSKPSRPSPLGSAVS